MKFGVPWHVKGVHPDARDSAREAARRAGMSVGEWLNSVILDSAGDDANPRGHHDPYAPPSYRAPPPPRDPVAEQVAAINRQLEGLTEGFENLIRSTTASRATWSEHDVTARRLADAIARLDQRVEQLAHEGRSASRALERRVESVDRALSSLGRARTQAGRPSGMDQAVAEITQRQRELDGDMFVSRRATSPPPRAHEDYAEVQDKLRYLTDQIDALGPGRMQEAIAALRNDLADVVRTLTDASPRRSIEALEAEVRILASRLDMRGRDGGGATFARLEQGLAEVRDTLHALTPAESLSGVVDAIHAVSRRIDQIAAGGADPGSVHQLEEAIAGLRGILSHVASSDALAALTEEVRALAARIESSPQAAARDNDILRTLEQRIATIADAIESVRVAGAHAPSFDIDAMVRTLGDKIERLHAAGSDHPALAQLDARIGELVRKLDASEARLGNLDAIERGMKELLAYLAETRREPTSDKPPVEAIARDVRRAEESIEAVHGTIGDVVDRLAMIETGIRGAGQERTEPPRPASHGGPAAYQTMPAVSSPPLQASQPRVHAVPDHAAAAQVRAAPAPAAPARQPDLPRPPAAAQPAAAQARPTADGALPYDYPLEPGSGKPRPGMAVPAPGPIGAATGGAAMGARAAMASPAERIARSKATLGQAKVAAPDADSKSNFILAARRAAQFAAETQSASPADVSVPTASAPTSLLQRSSRLVKPVLIGVSVVVLLAAAIHLAVNYFGIGGEQAVEQPQEPPKPQSTLLPPSPAARVAPPADLSSAPLLDLGGPASAAAGGSGVLMPAPAAPVAPVAAAPQPPVPMPPPAAAHAVTPAPMPAPAATPTPAPKAEAPPSPPAALNLAPPEAAGPSDTNMTHKLTPPPAGLFSGHPVRTAALPPAIGRKALISAAEGGDAGAAYEVALRYIEGRGVAANPEEAAVWFERAGRAGLTQALFRLGGLYEKGTGVKKDLQRARALYAEAAGRGHAKAMHNLAVLYAEGFDGKPDYVTAVKWFQKAAARGVADSQFNLGVLYARGIGMEQNLAESYRWFSLAAQTGDGDAAQKRDDVGKRLDAQTINAVRASIQKWAPEPQPEDATTVNAPAGGWDRDALAPAKTRSKRAQDAARVKVL